MASSSQGVRIAIQIVLAIVIVVLGYVLYESITEPYAVIERERELTDMTRERMSQIRAGMIAYENAYDRYPMTLDSLVFFLRDSLTTQQLDSVYTRVAVPNLDSLMRTPRRDTVFILTVNDTARVATYLLEDPDSDDYIGTLAADVTQINAASWE